MEKRQLGNSGLWVAPLAFGGNVFGWTIDEQTSFTILDSFVDAGLNLVDTADIYSNWKPGNHGGESETIIGKWLKKSGKRDRVVIATKVGGELSPDKKGASRKYILSEVAESLKRLQTDYIDLYQLHFDDKHTPQEETLEAFAQLIQEGKVKAIGASNMEPERLKKAFEISKQNNLPAYQTLQPLYNLYDREEYERKYALICKEYNLGVVSYASLASGFLSGKYHSKEDLTGKQRGQRVEKYMNDRGMRIIKVLAEVATSLNSKPATVALAWLIAQPTITAPIASATSIDQLAEQVKATELKLDDNAIRKLNEASSY
jgi:aryl-alcohol dehydrogenase-like predicted oxidoreductase